MINENLKRLRSYNKLTQEDVAEKLNVSRQSIAKWENGETMPDLNKCKELAELYDISLDDLVNILTNNKTGDINPKGKYVFGLATVNKDGQIIIPKEAREIFKIKEGDKLLILGDINQGLAILKPEELEAFSREILNAKEIKE